MGNAGVEGREENVREGHEDPQMGLRLFLTESLETFTISRLCQSLINFFYD